MDHPDGRTRDKHHHQGPRKSEISTSLVAACLNTHHIGAERKIPNARNTSKYKAFINTPGWHILCSPKCTKQTTSIKLGKGENMSEKTLGLINEHDARWVDLRFTDSRGKEQHVTNSASKIDEDFFENGAMFDGSSIAGWKPINDADMILMPDAFNRCGRSFYGRNDY